MFPKGDKMKDNLKKEMEQKILNETTYKDEINKTNNIKTRPVIYITDME